MAAQPALEFAGLLKELRAEAGLTQEELAEAAGLSPRTVSDLERGVHRLARQDTARLLAGALGLDGQARGFFVAAARGTVPAAEVLAARSSAQHQTNDGGNSPADGAWSTAVVAASPYQGLKAFGEQDAGFFFGREAVTGQVLARLSQLVAGTGLLMVSGASGVGKSSLLRAGVLPRIRDCGLAGEPGAARWPCLVFTPARSPLDELALRMGLLAGVDATVVRRELDANPARFALTVRQAALQGTPGPGGGLEHTAAEPGQRRVLLVVDQFEQLFTLCADEAQRRRFVAALHAAATAGHGPDQTAAGLVVLGVRADFDIRCADYPQLAGAVRDKYLVTPLTERQIRMAITEPAKKAGSAVDADLAEVLLAEARGGSGPGLLPFVSQVLDQAWRLRTASAVTLADYERAGGVEGALVTSADRVYAGLSASQQAAARQIFIRLAATGTGDAGDTTGRVTPAELIGGESGLQARDVAAVLAAFAGERLVTLAADGARISHGMLLTAWPLLRDNWLAGTHAARIARTRLHHAAAEWVRHSRDPSYLYGGSLLATVAGLAARIGADPAHHPPLSQAERDFLAASSRAHRSRTHRRRILAALAMALVTGLAAVAALTARIAYQTAHQSTVAISQQLISQSQILSRSNPVLSKLLSVEAWRLDPSSDARDAMAAAAAIPDVAVLSGHTGPVAFSPHGRLLASDSVRGGVSLWDVASNRPAGAPLASQAGPVISVAFSPKGGLLAAGTSTGTVRLWDVATHQPAATLTGHGGAVLSVAFSPKGDVLAAGDNDGTIRLWNVAAHLPSATLNGHDGAVLSVAFSPHGNTLATGNNDGTVRLWNTATRQPAAILYGHTGFVWSVAFNPGTGTLATGSADDTVRLWNTTASGSLSHSVTGSPGPAIARRLCAEAGRSLTRAQWAQYVPGQAYQQVCR